MTDRSVADSMVLASSGLAVGLAYVGLPESQTVGSRGPQLEPAIEKCQILSTGCQIEWLVQDDVVNVNQKKGVAMSNDANEQVARMEIGMGHAGRV